MANGETNGNGSRFIPWVWLAGTAVTLLISIAGFTLAETRGDIRSLQERKLDREQYYQDMRGINDKLDCLIKMHMDGKDR